MGLFIKITLLTLLLNTFLCADKTMLNLENDAIVGKDNHYTNGLYYVWMSENNTTFPDIFKFINLKQKNIAFSISHAIFTPKDKERATRNLDDLPYAGYLDFAFLFYKSSPNFFNEIGINLGLVGPSTRAGDLQKWFHGVIGHEKPKAWDTQLKDHFMNGISYALGYKTTPKKIKNLSIDLTTSLRGDLGNFYTGLLVGTTLRLSSIPLENFATTGNFIGANEALLLNYKERKNFNWAFSIGLFGNKFYDYYLVDKAIDEGYHLNKLDYMLGEKLTLDLYYNSFKTTFYLKSVDIFRDGISGHTNEQTGGISIIWKF